MARPFCRWKTKARRKLIVWRHRRGSASAVKFLDERNAALSAIQLKHKVPQLIPMIPRRGET
jgi:hypothetical protein